MTVGRAIGHVHSEGSILTVMDTNGKFRFQNASWAEFVQCVFIVYFYISLLISLLHLAACIAFGRFVHFRSALCLRARVRVTLHPR